MTDTRELSTADRGTWMENFLIRTSEAPEEISVADWDKARAMSEKFYANAVSWADHINPGWRDKHAARTYASKHWGTPPGNFLTRDQWEITYTAFLAGRAAH